MGVIHPSYDYPPPPALVLTNPEFDSNLVICPWLLLSLGANARTLAFASPSSVRTYYIQQTIFQRQNRN